MGACVCSLRTGLRQDHAGAGPGGRGKRAAAAFAGMRTTKRPVLYLDRENSAAFVAAVLKRMGSKDGGPLWLWGDGAPNRRRTFGSGIVQTWVLHCPVKPLVVVDSLGGLQRPPMRMTRQPPGPTCSAPANLADMGAVVVILHIAARERVPRTTEAVPTSKRPAMRRSSSPTLARPTESNG